MNKHKIAVLGGGNWGSTLAIMLFEKGYDVAIWEYDKNRAMIMSTQRSNPGFLDGKKIPEEINISSEMEDIIPNKDIVLFVVPSHTIRQTAQNAANYIDTNAILVSAVKGLEENTFKRMSEIISMETHKDVVVLSGPTIAAEVLNHVPTACVAASIDEEKAKIVQDIFSTDYFRVYRSKDIVGVELGGALKNIIAIGCGICDGMGLGTNAKSALVTRGIAEIKRMGMAMGAQESTFSGLSGLGDLITTSFSIKSRNRHVGEEIGKGKKLKEIIDGMVMVAEGVYTIKSVKQWADKNNIDMPITEVLYKILFNDMPIKEGIGHLMTRAFKAED